MGCSDRCPGPAQSSWSNWTCEAVPDGYCVVFSTSQQSGSLGICLQFEHSDSVRAKIISCSGEKTKKPKSLSCLWLRCSFSSCIQLFRFREILNRREAWHWKQVREQVFCPDSRRDRGEGREKKNRASQRLVSSLRFMGCGPRWSTSQTISLPPCTEDGGSVPCTQEGPDRNASWM